MCDREGCDRPAAFSELDARSDPDAVQYRRDMGYVPPGGTACGHPEYADGRCAEMSCANYVSKHVS